MAQLTPLWTAEPVTDKETIRSLLAERGIDYAYWALPDRVTALASQDRMSDDDKAEVLGHFQERLESCLLYTSPSPRDRG